MVLYREITMFHNLKHLSSIGCAWTDWRSGASPYFEVRIQAWDETRSVFLKGHPRGRPVTQCAQTECICRCRKRHAAGLPV